VPDEVLRQRRVVCLVDDRRAGDVERGTGVTGGERGVDRGVRAPVEHPLDVVVVGEPGVERTVCNRLRDRELVVVWLDTIVDNGLDPLPGSVVTRQYPHRSNKRLTRTV
jgi:hypothetical protein